MAAVFDLTRNPFHLLGLSIRAGRDEVVRAYEAALTDDRYDEGVLLGAQQALLAPRTRLAAEVSWFPGVPFSVTRDILSKLEQSELADAHKALQRLKGLDKANLAAALCARLSGKTVFVNALLEAYGGWTAGNVQATVSGLRSVSGFPTPDQQQVGGELAALRGTHARAAVACIAAAANPGKALAETVGTFLARDDDNIEQLLSLIIREYDAWSQPRLATIKEAIEKAIQTFRGGGDHVVPVDQLIALLAEWDAISQPVQMLEESKGHEEPRSKEIYWIIRKFCLWLANENGRHKEALAISRVMLETFLELPSVAAQLSQDVDALEHLAEEARFVELMGPLVQALEAIRTKSVDFDRDLVASGFGPKSRGLAKTLYDAFVDVAARTAGTELADMPWMAVRGLAIDLNNEEGCTQGACVIVEGLIAHKGTTPSTAVAHRLTDDQRTLRRNLNWEELKRGVSDDVSRGISLVTELLDGAGPDERAALLRLKAALERKRAFVIGRRVVWGLVLACTGFMILDSSTKPSYSLRPSSTAASTPSTTKASTPSASTTSSKTEEQIPPPGAGRLLNTGEVRYCVFQGARLDIIRQLLSHDAEVDRFNTLVDDFNSRCSSFRYHENVLRAVEAELPGRRPQLRQDVQHLLSSWRGSSSYLMDVSTVPGATLVQSRLKELGYYAGVVDGAWGSLSRAALRDFKSSQKHLGHDDRWDLPTQSALMGR